MFLMQHKIYDNQSFNIISFPIRNCIIDKNARIGKDVMIANLDVRIFLLMFDY